VASERQIAANRRNAQNSTGPRSRAGKRRASCNAYCHGLATSLKPSGQLSVQIETLARAIASAAAPSLDAATGILEAARTAAQAELDLVRIRKIKATTISSFVAAINSQNSFEGAHLAAMSTLGRPLPELCLMPSTSELPAAERQSQIERMRRLTTDILILDRYERRAIGRRDRAVLQIAGRNLSIQLQVVSGETNPMGLRLEVP
jgi:hypothetical protein